MSIHEFNGLHQMWVCLKCGVMTIMLCMIITLIISINRQKLADIPIYTLIRKSLLLSLLTLMLNVWLIINTVFDCVYFNFLKFNVQILLVFVFSSLCSLSVKKSSLYTQTISCLAPWMMVAYFVLGPTYEMRKLWGAVCVYNLCNSLHN